ncbi:MULTISPECIES: prephenate dehydratase domain-containing protein [unclassified Variovorax]|uniref:prephenate dehydratase domain-containing protein n=1 Tax=unclassified Variovorax TaxID=663243 RepID=UPI00210E0189|nr:MULTISPECIES: prephenate dehydratase domain-containing protein [unclassified Variovorax]
MKVVDGLRTCRRAYGRGAGLFRVMQRDGCQHLDFGHGGLRESTHVAHALRSTPAVRIITASVVKTCGPPTPGSRCGVRWRPVRFSPPLLLPVPFKLMKTFSLCAVTMATLAMGVSSITSAQIAYLGPAGSWTHEACMDLFGDTNLVALDRQALFKALRAKTVAKACVPATTSVVGVTPYLDDVLALDTVHVVGEHPKALGYSLLAKPGTRKEDIRTVLAHPVALEEVKLWLDLEMPDVERQPAASGQRRWVLGHAIPAPSGHDKTTLLLTVDEEGFQRSLQALAQSARVLAVYERPGKRSLDGHRYVIDVVGHASQPEIARLLADRAEFRLLGSYPRRY